MNGPLFPQGGGGDGADAQTMAAVKSVCIVLVLSIRSCRLRLWISTPHPKKAPWTSFKDTSMEAVEFVAVELDSMSRARAKKLEAS